MTGPPWLKSIPNIPMPATDGGDLGLKAKGEMGAVVDAAVFDANGKVIIAKDTVTGPLADTSQSTKGAMWLIQVTGIEDKTTVDAHRTILINAQLNDWFDQYTKDNLSRFTNDFNPDLQQFAFNEAVKR